MRQTLAIAVVSAALCLGPSAFLIASGASGSEITITPADFALSREKLLKSVSSLEEMAAISKNTADYARTFRDLQENLKRAKPPLAEWSSEDRDRVTALQEPTDAAWQALRTAEAKTQEQIRQRNLEAEQAFENQAAQREKLRQQAERDRLAEESQAPPVSQTTIYDNSYPYYGGTWWTPGHHHPNRPKPWENRYYGTKPNIPNNYEGNPVKYRR